AKEHHPARQLMADNPAPSLAFDDVSFRREVAQPLWRDLRRLRGGAQALFLAQHSEGELQPLIFDQLRRTFRRDRGFFWFRMAAGLASGNALGSASSGAAGIFCS